jgi:chemotaxis protein CheD
MIENVKVGMADMQVLKHPGMLTTLGLGSCVGVAVYDLSSKTIGLAHIMLPDSKTAANASNIFKFADTAIEKMIEEMISLGAKKSSMVAKVAGGAQMFAFSNSNDIMRIGERNTASSKQKLKELGIRVVGEDTGGNYGRTIEFYSDDGRLIIKTIGKGIKQI